VLAVRVPTEEKGLSAMVNITWRCCPYTSRVNSEDLTDNELDEVLNAKTSFKKRVITDLQIQQIKG
jgi:hypothetical protein